MTLSKQAIIDRTIKAINLPPAHKAEEISDFADFVSKRYEEQQLAQGIQQLAAENQAVAFLHDEEELYTGVKKTQASKVGSYNILEDYLCK
jgi:hypothetical protein